MSLKTRIMFAITVSVCVAILMVATPLYLGVQRLADAGSHRETLQMQARLQEGLQTQINSALSMAQTIAAIPRVKRAVEKQDTKGLHRLFVKSYSDFSAQTGITHFQFHSPDATTLLRVQTPDQNGDNVAQTRPMILQANTSQSPLAGLKRDPDGISIRGIAPVSDDDTHMGTVEIGLPFGTAQLEQMMTDSDARLEIYLLPATGALSEADQLQRWTGNFSGPALLSQPEVLSSLTSEPSVSVQTIEGAEYSSSIVALTDPMGTPLAIAHILVPQASYAAISTQITQIALGAAAAALILGLFMAFAFGASISRALKQVIGRMDSLASGDTKVEFDDLSVKGAEFADMARGLSVFRTGLIEADTLRAEQERQQGKQEMLVACLADGLKRVADGDLNTRLDDDVAPEYKSLIEDFNLAATQVSSVITQISKSATSVLAGADHIGQCTDDLATKTETSAATLEQTAVALQQLSSAVNSSAERAKTASIGGKDAIQKAHQGANIVRETVDAMTEIDRSAQEIARITGLIDDIAFQSNLLALNAGVEAARAGLAGSGFAVVAGEVHALALRTSEAAHRIEALIKASGQKVQHGVKLVARTGTALSDIVGSVEDVTQQIGQIADLASEQSQGLQEANAAVGQLEKTAQSNVQSFADTTTATQHLMHEGQNLQSLVAQFAEQTPEEQDQDAA